MRRVIVGAVISIILALVSAPSYAARVSPMIVELQPSGGGAIARVELTNDSERDIPFEARVMKGEISETGDLKLTPADEDFLVFPLQTVVQRKSQQVFRIQYVGDPGLDKSEIYYLSLQQIPVQFEPGKSQVQVVVNYNILANVVPKNSKPLAQVISAVPTVKEAPSDAESDSPSTAASQPTGDAPVAAPAAAQPGVTVRLANVGNRYFLAGLARWDIEGLAEDGTAFSRSYRAEEMTKIIGVGVVGPDRVREFFVPTDVPLTAESIRIMVNP